MPIRLTYLITDLKVGGVPLHLYRLATRLPRDEAQVRVISLADEGPVGLQLRRAGVPVQGCGARSPSDVRALGRLWQLLRSDPPDILHSLLFHANIAARVMGPLAGVPPRRIVCEIQTVERERRWHLPMDNVTCRLCRCEVGNSPSVVDHLHRQAHLPLSRLRTEWGAVDAEAIESSPPASREALGVRPDQTLILWTGRLDPVKGFEEMLAGFALACRGRPVVLAMAGEGPHRGRIEKLIREHGLDERVFMLGHRSDVPSLLRSADLFLFCSRTEGLPNAVLEAMAAGVPVIATDVPGCRDLIDSARTGWLVRPGDPAAIARGIEAALLDRALAAELGRAGQAWVRAHLDISDLAARWLAFYRSILAG
jgi:glycosyltransferase involved in cell wall biosynthesis